MIDPAFVKELDALHERVAEDLDACFAPVPGAEIRWGPDSGANESPEPLHDQRIHGSKPPRLRKKEPKGMHSRYELDATGAIVRASTVYPWDGDVFCRWARLSPCESVGRAPGGETHHVTRESFDDDGRLVRLGTGFGPGEPHHVEEYEYDDDGRLTAVVRRSDTQPVGLERWPDEIRQEIHYDGDEVSVIEDGFGGVVYASLPGTLDDHLAEVAAQVSAFLAELPQDRVAALHHDPESPLPPEITHVSVGELAGIVEDLDANALNPAEWVDAEAVEPPAEVARRWWLVGRTVVAKNKSKRAVALLEETAAAHNAAGRSVAYAVAVEEDDHVPVLLRQLPAERVEELRAAGLPL